MGSFAVRDLQDTQETPLSRFGALRTEFYQLLKEIHSFCLANGITTPEFTADPRISIALVGQYNAGKSTLVNALFGEIRAKTGDSPVTKKRCAYEWKDYRIVDLPGSDARIDEQTEALDALNGVQLAIYVVSSQSGLDRINLWTDLVHLSSANIPFILVVNNKAPGQSDEAEQSFRRTILETFQSKIASSPDLASMMVGSVFWVHARTAEKGRTEQKHLLEKKSGIHELEDAVLSILANNDAIIQDASKLRHYDNALKTIHNKLTMNLETSESRALSAIIDQCESARALLSSKSEQIACEMSSSIRDLVGTKMSAGVIGVAKNRETLANEIENITQSAFEKSCLFLSSQAKTQMDLIGSLLDGDKVQWADLNTKFKIDLGKLPGTEPSGFDPYAAIRRGFQISGGATLISKSVAKNAAKEGAKELVKDGAQVMAETAAKNVSKDVAKAAVDGGVKKGLQSAGKAAVDEGVKEGAGAFVKKALGPAIVILVAAWEIRNGYKQEKKEAELIRFALAEAEQKANLLCIGLKQSFITYATDLVSRPINLVISSLRVKIKSHASSQSKLHSDLRHISAFRDRLEELKSKITGSAHGL